MTIRRATIFVLLLFGFSASINALAQDEIAMFSAGGRAHTIVYPASGDAVPLAPYVIDSVTRTLPIYNALLGIDSPEVFVEILDTPSPDDTFAEAGRETTAAVPVVGTDETETRDVCQMTIYNNEETRDGSALLFTVAHEIAHCYQGYFIDGFTGYYRDTSDDWWAEGSAEWMATFVYREATTTPTLADYQSWFVENHAADLTQGALTYDAVYFWLALESQLGIDVVVPWLKVMPHSPGGSPDDYVAHLERLPDPAGIFHEYGRMAAMGELPFQPDPDDLFEDVELVSTFPREVEIYTDPFSFNTLMLEIPPMPDGQGISLTASGLEAHEMRLSVLGGETLADGVATDVCDIDEPVRLIISRVANDRPDTADLTIEQTDDCEETPDDDSAGGMDDCLVGTWAVTQFPQIPGITDIAIVSGAQLVSITPDGYVLVTTDDFTISMRGEISVELTVDASFVDFTINSIGPDGSVSVTPGASNLGTALVNVNGTMVAIDLNDAAGAVVAPAPLRMECGANTLFWYFDAGGTVASFTLAKVGEP
jgi:hypothetical protein